MAEHGLRGIIPPVVHPMRADGSLDSESLERLVGGLLEAGVHGLWINGTTGEFHALEAEQRVAAVRLAAKVARSAVPVIAHVGDTATSKAVAHARAAVDAGADHVAVLPPYFVDFTQDELCDHYRKITAATGSPVLVYHLPRLTKVSLTIDSILTLAADGVVVGVKDSASDFAWFRQLLSGAKRSGVSLRCFTGGSGVTDLGLFLGAAGAMPSVANLTPRYLAAMYDLAQAGDWARVRAMQAELDELLEAMRLPRRTATWSGTAAIYKYVLAELTHIDSDVAALPLAPLDQAERAHLAATAVPLIRRLEQAVQ